VPKYRGNKKGKRGKKGGKGHGLTSGIMPRWGGGGNDRSFRGKEGNRTSNRVEGETTSLCAARPWAQKEWGQKFVKPSSGGGQSGSLHVREVGHTGKRLDSYPVSQA